MAAWHVHTCQLSAFKPLGARTGRRRPHKARNGGSRREAQERGKQGFGTEREGRILEFVDKKGISPRLEEPGNRREGLQIQGAGKHENFKQMA